MAKDLRYEGATMLLGCVASFFIFIYLVRLFFLKTEGFEDVDKNDKSLCPPLSPAAKAAVKAAESAEKDKECGTRGLSPAAKAAAAAADAATAAKVAQVAEIAKKAAKNVMETEEKEKPKPDTKSSETEDKRSFSIKCPSGGAPIISYMGSFGGVGTKSKCDFGEDEEELEGANMNSCNLSSSTPAPIDRCPTNPYHFNPDEEC
jgi:hypothetical protein